MQLLQLLQLFRINLQLLVANFIHGFSQQKYWKSRKFVSQYPKEFSRAADGSLFCNLCIKNVKRERKSSVDKHGSSENHQNILKGYSDDKQHPISSFFSKGGDFLDIFIGAMVSAEIQLYKNRNM